VSPDASEAIARTFREQFGRSVAILARATGDIDLAEEAVQDAYAVALDRWPRDGVPPSPAGWIVTTAKRRMIDRLRRERALHGRQMLVAHQLEQAVDLLPTDDDSIPDERLELVFACCHPALAVDTQVPLTLRMVGGLTVPEIARGLLLAEATVRQRLVRAKRKIKATGIPLAVPSSDERPARLGAVLAVLYLVFNEGHTATTGDRLMREDLAAEAIRLAAVVRELTGDDSEATALYALMRLHHSRRAARVDEDGALVVLAEQDRSRWDATAIADTLPLVPQALRRAGGRPGPYALQAAIAALHASATRAGGTDWPQIAMLYDALSRVRPSPIVELNRAVAVAEAEGPAAALPLVERLAETLAGYHLLHATRADLLRRLDRPIDAAAAYARARKLTTNEPERAFLARRAAECDHAGRSETTAEPR
jgi:RNA polymerase sigma-70 factor (ECF subfamily)